MPESETIEVYTGEEVTITPLERREDGGARIELDVTDGPRWHVDVTRAGESEIVTSWDEDGHLADVSLPAWAGDVLTRLRGA